MYNFVNSSLGWFHLASSVVAMITGAYVLFTAKGTKTHKNIGYGYVLSMVLVCGSALGIYNLTGRFGMFHILAFVGFATLVAGMLPLLIKGIRKDFRVLHLWFMYYSVLGLYAAFASELSVRVPEKPFYTMVGIATGSIFVLGSFFIFWKEKVWSRYLLK
ncbi:DUF2306 domain-containing protein [Mariniradius saccharolyticus]|nr:DUF2306 domain-containing protein [Mariniradius saccharolyticus]